MTCIAAIVKNNKVYMGGDSAGTTGGLLVIRKDPKVFKVDEFLIGFTDSFRMGQLLRYKFDPPTLHNDVDLYRYMCTGFIDSLRCCLKENGFAETKNGIELGGCFLVGVKGRLFNIQSDYQVGESLSGYDSIGCGSEYALGALNTMEQLNTIKSLISPEEMISIALNTAAKFSPYVSEPFIILSGE